MADLEEEIQCPICFEVCIQPVVVSCGHLLCKYCIDQWASRVNSCPVCRSTIDSITRIANGDTIVTKAVALVSREAHSRRLAAIRQRAIDLGSVNCSNARRYTNRLQSAGRGDRHQLIHTDPHPHPHPHHTYSSTSVPGPVPAWVVYDRRDVYHPYDDHRHAFHDRPYRYNRPGYHHHYRE